MAVLNRDDFMNKIKEIVGDATDEANLTLIEDFTDTFDDLTHKATEGAGDWEKKYNDVNTKYGDLQKRYKERFFNGTPNKGDDSSYVPDPEPETPDPAETIVVDDLFETKE